MIDGFTNSPFVALVLATSCLPKTLWANQVPVLEPA